MPGHVARQVRKQAGQRGLSAFVTKALEHELDHGRLGAFLRDLEAEIGPADEAQVAAAERAFREP